MSIYSIRKERCKFCEAGVKGYLDIEGRIHHFAEPLFSKKNETTKCSAPTSNEYIAELEKRLDEHSS